MRKRRRSPWTETGLVRSAVRIGFVVGDERVADRFSLDAGDIERFFYGCSITHCLPVGMVGEGAAGTGTVMRSGTVRRYAEEAGFSGFEILPIENDFYRFYRLT